MELTSEIQTYNNFGWAALLKETVHPKIKNIHIFPVPFSAIYLWHLT